MSGVIGWIAAEAERPEVGHEIVQSRRRRGLSKPESMGELPVHGFPGKAAQDGNEKHGFESQNPQVSQMQRDVGHPDEPPEDWAVDDNWEVERERRIYRARTVSMLRRYMRYSIETGRLPSLLGREFFRAKVTSYTVVTFEDRVIFVHDMERCLEKLDEFSRQLIARHILEEHDRWATARLLHCNEKTVRRLTPLALDVLSEILIEVGLLERLDLGCEKSCQGGAEGENSVSACEDGENKF